MEIERKDPETDEIKIYNEQFYVSRNACLNYEEITHPLAIWRREMVEMVWWGKFPHLIKNDKDTNYMDAVGWCIDNCKGLVHTNRLMGMFRFELEKDALKFKLVWA